MVGRMTWIKRILTWTDSGLGRWESVLLDEIGPAAPVIGIESASVPAIVRSWLNENFPARAIHRRGKNSRSHKNDKVA